MKRFQFAVEATETPMNLTEIVDGLADAVHEVNAVGGHPERDPAVLVLGALVSFHTHADMNSIGGYQRLINMCRAQLDHQGNLQ